MHNNNLYDFNNQYINEKGYDSCFSTAKDLLVNGGMPSIFLITYVFVTEYVSFANATTIPNDEALEKFLLFCRKTNELKICQTANGFWDKEEYFELVLEIIEKFIELSNENPHEFYSSSKCVEYLFDFISKKMNIKVETKKKFPMFDDIIGLDKAKAAIQERVIDPSLHKEIFEKYGVQLGGGILLFGLPGTGKTMFAQATANEIDGYFINIRASDIKSKWYGETETKIKEVFDEAKKHNISVIFFDEFEAIGVSRDKLGAEITASSVVPELLSQMQGFEKTKNIILFIAATNRPWDIDSALLRPGRLDTLVYVDLPNYDCRVNMIKMYLGNTNTPEDIIEYLAKSTDGYNGSDIKNICDKLVRICIIKEIDGIKNYEIQFEDCVEILKENRSSVLMSDYNRMMDFCKENNI